MSLARFAYRLDRSPATGIWDMYRTYGPVCAFGSGPIRTVFLLGPEANRYLAQHTDNFSWRGGYEILLPLAGETALLASDGEGHHRRRRLVEPALHRDRVDGCIAHMVRHTDAVLDAWRPGQTVDVYREFRTAVRRATISSFFGPRLAAADAELERDLRTAMRVLNSSLPVHKILRAVPNPAWRGLTNAVARVDGRVLAEIAHRRAAPDHEDDLLTLLVSPPDGRKGLSDRELRDMIVSLIVASYDTTSAAIGWSVHSLLTAPDVWATARAELDRELPGDRPPTAAGLDRLRYLDWSVSEALRLYPPVMVGARRALAAFEFGGHRVPAGSLVVTSQYVTHRLPELWPEPHRFRPERWDPGQPGYRRPDPYSYLPFGAGFRRCPGSSVARANIKAALVQLLRRTRLTLTATDVRPAGLSAMYPRHGLPARVDRVRA
ncbi:cytochrome P450 [Streptomyces sp. AV19]|uniref:cytochrome P450 n=1 Tax=Streptomyces sp. AV19 TaxID=2793068 RepID=UPI0018FE5C7C|nr:cytochrome P450 [Streptomyces sp. AV19]MBH1937754.1 cytochrome P450 [Streptomyces sp. AV19]MDG4536423.1 cytochrome P450 [Streptomyces sp. AV19]